MNASSFALFPSNDRDQELRLKRFLIASGAYAMNMCFVLVCWAMDYFTTSEVTGYVLLVLAINVGIYLTIRTDFNKRFADPSLTFVQLALASLSGLYLMYFGDAVRSTFLLLGVAAFVFGMLRFKTRGFIYLSAFILGGYAILIALLVQFRPADITLRVDVLQWMALLVTMAQFTYLAGFIGNLRRKVRDNNIELEKRNGELEAALKQISDMAIRDELTGVYNRRYLMERIAEETQRCIRNGSVFCICIIDIDFFKQINDTYGHLVGDEVLRKVATTASGALRQTDFFGRFGGEEFVMVLTDTLAEGALTSAERVRKCIEGLAFPDVSDKLKVTISIGIAEHARRGEPEATFKCADDALYRAKEGGRNRCVVAVVERG
ncbi:MAG TPA: diguanylate cyclase [Noviherbaspirillum sp.]|jgi:diguanylate cyclase (GGDEF)-like protein|uniref:GGDEF domain-containing protein n=1 Tax=Noviherbaspirillum sp. TaxID=1926288 RepID=UPI002DDCB605|nr:diguanylate cyclase [Noviherbaspirillum sp.]HEV2610733.1 diguanylate cyclase [Noviherbaspirillum sp.]